MPTLADAPTLRHPAFQAQPHRQGVPDDTLAARDALADATERIREDMMAGADPAAWAGMLRWLVTEIADVAPRLLIIPQTGGAEAWARRGAIFPHLRLVPHKSDPVRNYLATRPWLSPLVAEGRREIARIFGADARVRLEVVIDDEGAEQLFAFVAPALAPEAAYAALTRLDEEWLFDAPTRGQFNVDVEVGGEPDAI